MEGLERLREVIAKRYGLLFLFVCCGDENVLKLTVCPKLCGSGVVGWITRGLLFFHRPQVFNMADSRASSLPGVMPCPCYLRDSGKMPPLTMVNSILRDLREKAI